MEFSIIGISENWGTIQNIDVQNIPGYSHKYCIRTNGNKGGGVSLYVKKSISYKVRTKVAFQTNDFESLLILSINNSAPGYDDIPASVMQKCLHDYITPLTYLVNSSIKQGIFPSELKIAKVFPIFKAGDEQLITNYRPISVYKLFF